MARGPCSCGRGWYHGRVFCDAPGGCANPGGPKDPGRRRLRRQAAQARAAGPPCLLYTSPSPRD
eukprot:13004412-Alexandrium_andersonii.AAC.1